MTPFPGLRVNTSNQPCTPSTSNIDQVQSQVPVPTANTTRTPSLYGRLEASSEQPEGDDVFFDMLVKCQGSRLNDQRCAAPPSTTKASTVPDEDFFSLILRSQSNRMEEQRVPPPSGVNQSKPGWRHGAGFFSHIKWSNKLSRFAFGFVCFWGGFLFCFVFFTFKEGFVTCRDSCLFGLSWLISCEIRKNTQQSCEEVKLSKLASWLKNHVKFMITRLGNLFYWKVTTFLFLFLILVMSLVGCFYKRPLYQWFLFTLEVCIKSLLQTDGCSGHWWLDYVSQNHKPKRK